MNLKKAWMKRIEIKMGGQGLCSVTADGNKILIITIQAAKCCLSLLFTARVFLVEI